MAKGTYKKTNSTQQKIIDILKRDTFITEEKAWGEFNMSLQDVQTILRKVRSYTNKHPGYQGDMIWCRFDNSDGVRKLLVVEDMSK